jgi:hypothetical protein
MAVRPIIFSAPMIHALLDGRKTQTRRIVKGVPMRPLSNCHPNHDQKHPAPYLDSYCCYKKVPENPRGMSDRWCWWQVDDRQCLPTFKVPFVPGDLLWVRESWQVRGLAWGQPISASRGSSPDAFHYKATDDGQWKPYWGGWKPSIHMPKWASRLTLRVTDVRVERLDEISEADAKAEGMGCITKDGGQTYKYGIPDRDGEPGSDDVGWDWSQWCLDPRRAFSDLWGSIHGRVGEKAWGANPWVVVITFEVIKQNVNELTSETEAA